MDHAALVRRAEPVGHLPRDAHDAGETEPPLGQQHGEGLAGEDLHREVELPLGLTEVEQAHRVRVLDARGDLHLRR